MLSLIIPVYRNEANIPSLLDAMQELQKRLNNTLEIVFVVDGSPDRSFECLRAALPTTTLRAQVVLLSRNFGAFSAVRAGLVAARGDSFAVMAADLQEPPELILSMNDKLLADSADVIIGTREARSDPLSTRLSSGMFWWFYRRYIVPDMPEGGVDIFACNRTFRDSLLLLEEHHSSLIAQIFWLGFRRAFIPYERQQRQIGKSAWTLRKRVTYLADSIFSFSDLPIRLLIRLGGSVALLSGLFGMLLIISRLTGWLTVPGYAATMLAIVFFGSLNLLALGVVGSYAWRTFENTKARPLTLVLQTLDYLPPNLNLSHD